LVIGGSLVPGGGTVVLADAILTPTLEPSLLSSQIQQRPGHPPDQSLSAALSFFFTAALIGGSGYILFQFPAEMQTFDRQKQDFANRQTRIRQFTNMLDFFLSGWFASPANWEPEEVFFRDLPHNITARALNPTLKQDILNWTSSSLPRLASERGHIEGFMLSDDIQQSLQEQLLKIYGTRISATTQLDEMVRSWEEERPRGEEPTANDGDEDYGGRWSSHVLQSPGPGTVSARRHVRGQDPEGSQAGRFTHRATHGVRAGDQPETC
jgi:hypothetical protein